MTLLLFFERYSHFKFIFFWKISIFLKFWNCCIIIAQTTYFENIKYCKIYIHYGLGLTKTCYNDPAAFFGRYSYFKLRFILKKVHFSQVFNCRIIKAQTTYFENIKYCKEKFHYGLSLAETSYNDSISFFWKIFSFQISIFFKNVHFSQVFKLPPA